MKSYKTFITQIIVLTVTLIWFNIDVYAQYEDGYNDDKLTYSFLSELHYNNEVYSSVGSAKSGKFDLHKVYFKAGYKINKNLKFKTAFKVEHAFDSQYNGGDAFFKQAYFDYYKSPKIGLKVGLVNTPVISSKSGSYSGVEIAPVEKYLYQAWRELGVILYGNFTPAISYQASITTGLEASEISSKSGIYSARNSDLFTSVNNLSAAAEMNFRLNANFSMGASAMISGLQSKQEFGSNLNGAGYTLMEGYASYKTGALTTRLVGVYSTIQESDKINHVLDKHIGSSQYGSLIEINYDILYSPNKHNRNNHLIIYSRAEAYNTQLTTLGFEADPKYERYQYTLGLLYKPFKQIEFKSDYQWLNSGNSVNLGHLNFAIAYSF